MKETIKERSTNNTKNDKYSYTYYQNNHTIVKTPKHTHIPTLYETSYNNHSTRYTPNKIAQYNQVSLE
jgi:hypothetical protein